MKQSGHKTLITLSVVLAFCLCGSAKAQQSTAQQNTVGRPASPLRIISYGGDLKALLAQMAKTFDVTIGFEVAPNEPHSYVSMTLNYPTIEDVLDSIVKNKPIYQWQSESHVLKVHPLKGGDAFLDTPVTSFHVKDATPAEALEELLMVWEIRSTMSNSGLQLSRPQTNIQGNKVTIDLVGTDLRHALNRIASDSGSKFWVFQRSGARREYFSISLE